LPPDLIVSKEFIGCASIVNGTRQEISVSTNPQDALVSDGETTVKTLGKLSLKKDEDRVLPITKPELKPNRCVLFTLLAVL
jgi:hypothetical protein